MKVLQIVILIFALNIFANAQNTILSGKIFDSNGAVMPGIKVVAYSQSKVRHEQLTDGNGIYTINLPVGIYNLEINKQNGNYNGFDFVSFKNYQIVSTDDGRMNLDFSLPLIGDGIICELIVESPKATTNKSKKKISKRKNK